MNPSSSTFIFLMFALVTSASVVVVLANGLNLDNSVNSNNPSEVLRESINKAAGRELIPEGTTFQLTDVKHYSSESGEITYLNRGHERLSESGWIYNEKITNGDSSASLNSGPHVIPLLLMGVSLAMFTLIISMLYI